MNAVFQIARADFLERTRRYQYLLLVVSTLVIGMWLVPSRSAPYATFVINSYTGIYNSAWMGALFAAVIAIFVSLFGFYFVKSAIDRDRQTRVGEIIAATPIGKFAYVAGKALSNFSVLFSVTAILFVDAVIMQFIRGESTALNLAAIAGPFLLVALPVIALVAAVAVLFEVLPLLRGGIGNIAYFILWLVLLANTSGPMGWLRPMWMDVFGVNFLSRKINAMLPQVRPHDRFNEFGMIIEGGAKIHRFIFTGFAWSLQDVVTRLAWFFVALAIVAVAAIFFDRFVSTAQQRSARTFSPFARFESTFEQLSTPVLNLLCRNDMGSLVLAELRIMFKGLSPWWYLTATGLWIATLFASGSGQTICLAFLWGLPILIWSQLGTRESANGTEQLIYPSLHPLRRHFLAQWTAGVILATVLATGSTMHLLLTGNPHALIGILAGALFLPTLALACGAVSGTTRVFEIVYLMLWYCGPMNDNPSLDYTGAHAAPAFLVATIVLLALAFASRRWRLQVA